MRECKHRQRVAGQGEEDKDEAEDGERDGHEECDEVEWDEVGERARGSERVLRVYCRNKAVRNMDGAIQKKKKKWGARGAQ